MSVVSPPARPTVRTRAARRDVLAALPAWLAARGVVLASWLAARVFAARYAKVPEPVGRHLRQGLLGWDAERYAQIAVHGYAELPTKELRFFPLFPLAARYLDVIVPGTVGRVLLLVANVSALALGAAVHRLALVETGDRALARRAAWYAAFTPAGFVLVWGYSEALWGLLVVGAVAAARRGRWRVVAPLALLVGLVRPVGLLVSVPLGVEAVRALRRRPRRLPAVAASLAAAPAGAVAYLIWVQERFHTSFLLPFRIQESKKFRGPVSGPFTSLGPGVRALLDGRIGIDAVRVGWVVLLVVLVVHSVRRWPAAYSVLAVATAVVALATTRLGSFERYTFMALPFTFALAGVTRRRAVHLATLTTMAVAMGVYGTLALVGPYTP
ncbi:MAG: hypothetical protein HYX34_07345 [Actinobacteria bacterium]|nr:hypothetical protein [Actinomycetota bacterium]